MANRSAAAAALTMSLDRLRGTDHALAVGSGWATLTPLSR
jgi:hypothetical protein